MNALSQLRAAAVYATLHEERTPGTFVLLVATEMGIEVKAKTKGRTYDRIVPWSYMEHAEANQLICAIDSALDGLSKP